MPPVLMWGCWNKFPQGDELNGDLIVPQCCEKLRIDNLVRGELLNNSDVREADTAAIAQDVQGTMPERLAGSDVLAHSRGIISR